MKAKKKQNIANQMSSESNEWYTPGIHSPFGRSGHG